MADNKYRVDHAPTGRATCKYKPCSKKIEKGGARIGKMKPNFFDTDGDTMSAEWHHPPCWFLKQQKMKKSSKMVDDEGDLEGFDEMAPDEQEMLRDLIEGKTLPAGAFGVDPAEFGAALAKKKPAAKAAAAKIVAVAPKASLTAAAKAPVSKPPPPSTPKTSDRWSATMSRVDGDTSINIPNGKTILGRGEFLNIDDKQVSRNQAEVEFDVASGRLTWTVLGANPSALVRGEAEPQLLTKADGATVLQEGDRVDLVVGKWPFAIALHDRGPQKEEEKGVKRKRTGSLDMSEKPICKYDPGCYRKNPEHLAEFSHPSRGPEKAEDDIEPADDATDVDEDEAGGDDDEMEATSTAAPSPVKPVKKEFAAENIGSPKKKSKTKTAEIEFQAHPNYNEHITSVLEQVGLVEKNMGDGMKHKVYMKAATALQMLDYKISSGKEAKKIDGVGAKIAAKIDEIIATGTLAKLEEIRADPRVQAIQTFCRVSGIGPVLARKLADEHKIRTIEDLRKLEAEKHLLNNHQRIGLAYFEEFETKIPREEIAEVEKIVLKVVHDIDPQLICMTCGSYRRGKPLCGDIDMLLSHPDYKLGDTLPNPNFCHRVVDKLIEMGLVTDTIAYGADKFNGVSVLPGLEGALHRRLDVLWIPYDQYFCGLLYFTGSGFFNIQMRRIALDQNYTLSETGIQPIDENKQVCGERLPVTSEKDVFDILGMKWREPHERDLASKWKPTMS